jgi:predicted nucleic-acid-binding Zn-ribbon protein
MKKSKIISVDSIIPMKCPWCGSINEFHNREISTDGIDWSRLVSTEEHCWYCKKKFLWDVEDGISKIYEKT